MIVPRRKIGIANRPVATVAVLLVGGKIEIAPAQRHAAPHQRTPTEVKAAIPGEGLVFRRRIGAFAVVHPEGFVGLPGTAPNASSIVNGSIPSFLSSL